MMLIGLYVHDSWPWLLTNIYHDYLFCQLTTNYQVASWDLTNLLVFSFGVLSSSCEAVVLVMRLGSTCLGYSLFLWLTWIVCSKESCVGSLVKVYLSTSLIWSYIYVQTFWSPKCISSDFPLFSFQSALCFPSPGLACILVTDSPFSFFLVRLKKKKSRISNHIYVSVRIALWSWGFWCGLLLPGCSFCWIALGWNHFLNLTTIIKLSPSPPPSVVSPSPSPSASVGIRNSHSFLH